MSVSYPPPPAQAPPAEVQSYTPSLSAAPESSPTASPPGRRHVHGATHVQRVEDCIHFRIFWAQICLVKLTRYSDLEITLKFFFDEFM